MNHFLWPEGSYRVRSLRRIASATAGDIERALNAMFPGSGHPVAVSSGRAGLAMILQIVGLRRPDLVQVPAYASHCVLEAVSRLATPLPAGIRMRHAARIIYHQWGYVQQYPETDVPTIEDACDTLCEPGAPLFPLRGRFEIWSLPKILGCSSGGIVWCRDSADADMLRKVRETRRGGAWIQWLLRVFGKASPALAEYWAGREAACGALAAPGAADLLASMECWTRLYAERQKRLALLDPYVPAWLPRSVMRMPCVVPLEFPLPEDRLRQIGIDAGVRHFERRLSDGATKLVPVVPLPIHQDVSDAVFEQVLSILETTPPRQAVVGRNERNITR